jgi:hypothetical protein
VPHGQCNGSLWPYRIYIPLPFIEVRRLIEFESPNLNFNCLEADEISTLVTEVPGIKVLLFCHWLFFS